MDGIDNGNEIASRRRFKIDFHFLLCYKELRKREDESSPSYGKGRVKRKEL
jgi:hypothetical protein